MPEAENQSQKPQKIQKSLNQKLWWDPCNHEKNEEGVKQTRVEETLIASCLEPSKLITEAFDPQKPSTLFIGTEALGQTPSKSSLAQCFHKSEICSVKKLFG